MRDMLNYVQGLQHIAYSVIASMFVFTNYLLQQQLLCYLLSDCSYFDPSKNKKLLHECTAISRMGCASEFFLKCFGSYFDLSIEMKLLACSDMVLRYQVQFGHW
jgi:hypothetical protein